MSQFLIDYITALHEDFESYCLVKLDGCGITHAQVAFIVYIGNHPNCSPSELAAQVSADSGYTARSIKKLVESGLALKEQQENDRRAYSLKLTELGLNVFDRCNELHQQWEQQITETLEKDELDSLMSILSKLGF